ncbi:MAG TPA: hypothetical protein VM032_07680 [Vicinamibacterales bacterium]|nr:hypothetical protein [Vicinamibacterales bacterium]
METSVLRKRLSDTIDTAKRTAAERRARSETAARAYSEFLDTIAVPLFKQVQNILKASGYGFTVFTPSGAVRLMSEKSSEDYIELSLDASGEEPMVLGRSSRARGRRVIENERAIAEVSVAHLTEEHVVEYLLKELEPFVER